MLFPASHLETGPDRISGSESLIIFGLFLLSEFQEPKLCAIANRFLRKSCSLSAFEAVCLCLFFTGNTPSYAVWQLSRECVTLGKKQPPKPSGVFDADSSDGFV